MKLIAPALILLFASLPALAADTANLHVRDTRAEGWTLQGAADDRWEWTRGGGLELRADSTEPSARLLAPLPFTLDGSQGFSVEVDVTFDELVASPDDFFQVSLGLVNTQSTGLNRTGTSLPVAPALVETVARFVLGVKRMKP